MKEKLVGEGLNGVDGIKRRIYGAQTYKKN